MAGCERLKDRVAIITGAGSGIGEASAVAFAREGALVVAVDVRDEGASVVDMMRAAGGDGLFVAADVARAADVQRMVQTAMDRYGRIDVLFNNAAVTVVKYVDETSEEEWDRVMAVNVKSIYLACREVVPNMRRQGKGDIINTVSFTGIVAQVGTPAYAASKGAVVNLTRALAVDHAHEGIRVNCICPGVTATPLLEQHFSSLPDPEAARRERTARIPIGRFTRPEEIAAAAIFLAGDESAAMTGAALVVDGGMLASPEYGSLKL
jgi:NAD(P)-dependent dehydrogenase (short-subunit alcohol dehydrogenase family)